MYVVVCQQENLRLKLAMVLYSGANKSLLPLVSWGLYFLDGGLIWRLEMPQLVQEEYFYQVFASPSHLEIMRKASFRVPST